MNKVMLSGIVPSFENSGRSFNIEDEKNARFSGQLNTQGWGKDENGKPKNDPIEFIAFGQTAQFLANHWKKGQGFELEGRLTPSRKRTNADGSAVMTSEGKPVYSGIGLTVFKADFSRNYATKDDAPASTAGTTVAADPFATGAPAGQADPFATAAPATGAPAAQDPFAMNDPFGMAM